MSLSEKAQLRLTYLGEDAWSRPVYRDQHQHLWKDVSGGMAIPPSLCSCVGNEFDGEPDMPIGQDCIFIKPPENEEKSFQYMMLYRLRCDCEYYLGYGNRNDEILCSNNPQKHIEAMKRRWLEFADSEKPQWLTWGQILAYEKQMCITKGEAVHDRL